MSDDVEWDEESGTIVPAHYDVLGVPGNYVPVSEFLSYFRSLPIYNPPVEVSVSPYEAALANIEWEMTYQRPTEDAMGDYVGAPHYRYRDDVHAQALISLKNDLPAYHQADKEGYCECWISNEIVIGIEPEDRRPLIKPYEWL